MTLDYYNSNASSYINDTIGIDVSGLYTPFMKYLPTNAKVLDFGCGSGRDSKYFMSQGYQVDAVDGSIELCKQASIYLDSQVTPMLFNDLNADKEYDGIWACASVLHLTKGELKDVFPKMLRAIKDNGIIYVSFKYGFFEGYRTGRYYTDFTCTSFQEFVKDMPISIKKEWITKDNRNQVWLNLLLKKK